MNLKSVALGASIFWAEILKAWCIQSTSLWIKLINNNILRSVEISNSVTQ